MKLELNTKITCNQTNIFMKFEALETGNLKFLSSYKDTVKMKIMPLDDYKFWIHSEVLSYI